MKNHLKIIAGILIGFSGLIVVAGTLGVFLAPKKSPCEVATDKTRNAQIYFDGQMYAVKNNLNSSKYFEYMANYSKAKEEYARACGKPYEPTKD